MIPLLPRRIPDLELHRCITHRQSLREERRPNCRFLPLEEGKKSQTLIRNSINHKPINYFEIKPAEIVKIHLEFEELAFHEAQDEARLARAHVSKQNLWIRREYRKGKKKWRDFEREVRWEGRESYRIRREMGWCLTYELGVEIVVSGCGHGRWREKLRYCRERERERFFMLS